MTGWAKFPGKQASYGAGLSELLDKLDTLIGKLGLGLGKQALEIPALMDEIEARIAELHLQGASIQAEESQYEASCAALRKAAGSFLREVGGPGALKARRLERQPDPEAWWWYLDEVLAQRAGAGLKRLGLILGIVVLALGLLAVVYVKFLAPDPKVVAVYNASNLADGQAAAGNYAAALGEVEKGLAQAPTSPELLVRQGVLLDLLGRSQEAAAAYQQAQASLSGVDFFLVRGQIYFGFRLDDQAQKDARAALAADPNNAVAYLLLGGAQENEGNNQAALASYTRAAALADAQGDTSLTAQARIKLAYLMQSMGVPSLEVATGTPTP